MLPSLQVLDHIDRNNQPFDFDEEEDDLSDYDDEQFDDKNDNDEEKVDYEDASTVKKKVRRD